MTEIPARADCCHVVDGVRRGRRPEAGQSPAPAARGAAAKTFAPPKTPWGDPDIQGGYSNKDENGIPFERPGNLAGKQLGEIDDSELAELAASRDANRLEAARGIGGREPARARSTGTSTTARRTAAPGWSSIRRTARFPRRPRRHSAPRRGGAADAAARSGARLVKADAPTRTPTAASTIAASRAGCPAR